MSEPGHGQMFDELEHGMFHHKPLSGGEGCILLTVMGEHLGFGLSAIQELTIHRVMMDPDVDPSSLVL